MTESEQMLRSYRKHKSRAKHEGKPFTLSAAEWISVWLPHWSSRQKRMMCRILDLGGYTLGNVYIGTARDNYQDQQCVKRWNTYWRNWEKHHLRNGEKRRYSI